MNILQGDTKVFRRRKIIRMYKVLFAYNFYKRISILKATEILVINDNSKRHLNEAARSFCLIISFLTQHAVIRGNIYPILYLYFPSFEKVFRIFQVLTIWLNVQFRSKEHETDFRSCDQFWFDAHLSTRRKLPNNNSVTNIKRAFSEKNS